MTDSWSLGAVSSNPRLGTSSDPLNASVVPQTRTMGMGDGEAAPSDQDHLCRLDYWAALKAMLPKEAA